MQIELRCKSTHSPSDRVYFELEKWITNPSIEQQWHLYREDVMNLDRDLLLDIQKKVAKETVYSFEPKDNLDIRELSLEMMPSRFILHGDPEKTSRGTKQRIMVIDRATGRFYNANTETTSEGSTETYSGSIGWCKLLQGND